MSTTEGTEIYQDIPKGMEALGPWSRRRVIGLADLARRLDVVAELVCEDITPDDFVVQEGCDRDEMARLAAKLHMSLFEEIAGQWQYEAIVWLWNYGGERIQDCMFELYCDGHYEADLEDGDSYREVRLCEGVKSMIWDRRNL